LLLSHVSEEEAAPLSPEVDWTNCPVLPTVKLVDPVIEPDVAVIVALPVATPVASPVLLIVATVVVVELHVTELVKFWVLPSLLVPVAVNCSVAPRTIEELAGVTAIDTSTAAVTVRPVEPLIEPDVAWIVVLPEAAAVAKPLALIVATVGFVEVQVAEFVRFKVLPSL
jgi:hypothetical protein